MSLELATPPEYEAEIAEMQRLAAEKIEEKVIPISNAQRTVKIVREVREPLHIISHLQHPDGFTEWITAIVDGEDLKHMDMGRMPGVMSPVEEKKWERFLSRKRTQISKIGGRNRIIIH